MYINGIPLQTVEPVQLIINGLEAGIVQGKEEAGIVQGKEEEANTQQDKENTQLMKRYTGKKFKNCLHFVNRFLRDELGTTLPLPLDTPLREAENYQHLKKEHVKKEVGSHGDVVTLKRGASEVVSHIGVLFDGRIWHYTDRVWASSFSHLSRMKLTIDGYYEPPVI